MNHKTGIFLLGVVVLVGGIFLAFDFHSEIDIKNIQLAPLIETLPIKHIVAKAAVSVPVPVVLPKPLANPPSIIKSVYATGWSAGTKNYNTYLDNLFATTQVNSVVIDVKDNSGHVTYASDSPLVLQYNSSFPEISKINALIEHLHSQGIYVIGRIVVFQDPVLAKARPDLAIYDVAKTIDLAHPVPWQDNNGLSWMDPASKQVWAYNIAVAKDALEHGFDEVNFDYVRFPTDGNTGAMGFPVWDQKILMHQVIRDFFKTLSASLPSAKISVDLFGQTATTTGDMGIGQIIEDTFGSVDYVCPMIYPSHYINGFLGYPNPADFPYQVVANQMQSVLNRQKVFMAGDGMVSGSRDTMIRPWLQDFNIGAQYDAPKVLQEIQAVTDSTKDEFAGFMLWNPNNYYTRGALGSRN